MPLDRDEPAPLTFRYLPRFRCIGPDCEEHCCGRWRIAVDEATHARLAALVPPEALARMIEHDAPDGAVPMSMRFADDGNCVMLGADRLCRLQAEHGEEALPDTCAAFPRHANRVNDRLELTATVACPEVARLVLLADDAMEPEEAAPSLMPRPVGARRASGDDAPPYRRHFPLVRSVILQLLGLPGYPLESRLFFISYLAASIHPFYHAKSEEAGFPLGSLHHQLALILHPEAQKHLAAQFAAVPFDPGVGAVVIETLRVLATSASPRLRPMMRAALEGCEDPAGTILVEIDGRALRLSLARLAEVHRARRAALPPAHAARLDAAITRYLENLAVHAWYTDASDLFLHQQALLIRLAVLRFLALGQPGVADDDAALDRAVVALFSTVTRAFDHDAQLTEALVTAIKSMGASSPAHAARIIGY